MTNNDVSHEEQLRVALGRYQARLDPVEPDWGSIEAQRPVPGRHRSHWWRITPIAVLALATIVILVAVNFVSVKVDIGQSRAQAKSTPAPPQYHPVARPTFPAGSTMAAIQARGFLRVGVKADQLGFGFRDPGTGVWSGFDVEMAKLMALGIFGNDGGAIDSRIMWVPVVSKDRESAIVTGTVDLVIATYTINDERKQLVDFAGPYLRARQDMIVRTGDTSITGVADLNGRAVCTVRGSTSYQNLLRAAPRAEVELRDTYSACAEALAGGRVEAVSTDDAILAGLVHEHAFAFKMVDNPFSDEPYGIGLKKGDSTFRAFLDDRLAAIEADGDWALAHGYALQNIRSFSPPPIERP